MIIGTSIHVISKLFLAHFLCTFYSFNPCFHSVAFVFFHNIDALYDEPLYKHLANT